MIWPRGHMGLEALTSLQSCSTVVAKMAELLLSHEGAVNSQNYVGKRLTKKECFKTLTKDVDRPPSCI